MFDVTVENHRRCMPRPVEEELTVQSLLIPIASHIPITRRAMGQEWYGTRSNSDVDVFLVRSLIHFEKQAASADSTDQGSTAKNVKKEEKSISRKRKRRDESEHDEQNLGELHVHSSRLRRCSKYFDTCLSKRWTGAESSRAGSETVRLSLEVHTDVKYYKVCFSRMYSPFLEVPNVNHSLKLLQVASQIGYQELVEVCVCYLAAVPWSLDDEKRIREFAKTLYYPSDCAADLSARLGLPLSSTERHSNLLRLTQNVLGAYFTVCTNYDDESLCQDLFSSAFRQIMAGSCQTLAERVLKFVNDRVKRMIYRTEKQAKEDPFILAPDALRKVRWNLMLLLETRTAKEVVEYIVERSTLDETLKGTYFSRWRKEWIDIILCIIKQVIEGHLWLKTSTRHKLIDKYLWLLGLGSEVEKEREIAKILSTFVMTFPYEQQKEIFFSWVKSAHMLHRPNYDFLNLDFQEIHENWIDHLQERLVLLEQQRSTTNGACQNASQSSATPPRSSPVPASSSTCETHSSSSIERFPGLEILRYQPSPRRSVPASPSYQESY